jgi:CRISPR-associated protein Cas5d
MARDRASVLIEGDLALFTRPEMKVERVSYEAITPSAARGVLDAICWKPQMRWSIRRIIVLNPPRFMSVRRNEVGGKMPSTARGWAAENHGGNDYYADDDRQQRNALLLCDVAYVVEAQCRLTPKSGPDDTTMKYVEVLERRITNGQHFQQPYLGCREFPARVKLATGIESPAEEIIDRGDVDLGWMLHDIDYPDGGEGFRVPRFFHAVMRRGVIDVPEFGQATRGGMA